MDTLVLGEDSVVPLHLNGHMRGSNREHGADIAVKMKEAFGSERDLLSTDEKFVFLCHNVDDTVVGHDVRGGINLRRRTAAGLIKKMNMALQGRKE
jgi:hypothetical protein